MMLPYSELEVVDAVMMPGQGEQICGAQNYLKHNKNCCWGSGLLAFIW